MTAYIVAFLASALIGSRASVACRRKKVMLVILGCLPLALLAGLRSTTVGVDTSLYPLVTYTVSLDGGPIQASEVTHAELGFSVIIWLLAIATHNFNAVLFCVQAIMLALLAFQLIRTDSRHVGTALFVYACIFLPWSFNLMRQALAASFFLPAFQCALEKKPARFALCIAIAVSIHRAALVGLFLWPLCRIALSDMKTSSRLLTVVACLFGFALTILIPFGEGLLDLASLIKSSYSAEVLGDGRFNVLFTFYPMMLALLPLFSGTTGAKCVSANEDKALNPLMFFTSCASLLSVLSRTLFRVAYTFFILAPLQVSHLLDSVPSDSNRRALCAVVLLSSAFVFLWAYCYGDAAGAYPYRSDILGIG